MVENEGTRDMEYTKKLVKDLINNLDDLTDTEIEDLMYLLDSEMFSRDVKAGRISPDDLFRYNEGQ